MVGSHSRQKLFSFLQRKRANQSKQACCVAFFNVRSIPLEELVRQSVSQSVRPLPLLRTLVVAYISRLEMAVAFLSLPQLSWD